MALLIRSDQMQTFMLKAILKVQRKKGNAKELSIVIIPFDPNIPNNTEDYAKKKHLARTAKS